MEMAGGSLFSSHVRSALPTGDALYQGEQRRRRVALHCSSAFAHFEVIVAASLEHLVEETLGPRSRDLDGAPRGMTKKDGREELAIQPDAESDAGAEAGARRRKHRESTRSW